MEYQNSDIFILYISCFLIIDKNLLRKIKIKVEDLNFLHLLIK